MTDLSKVLKASEDLLHPYRAMEAQFAPALTLRKQLAPIFDMQAALAPALSIQKTLRPILDIQEALRPVLAVQDQWKTFVAYTPPWVDELSRTARAITGALTPVMEQVRLANDILGPAFRHMARTSAQCERIEDAGWLPHYTIPFDQLDVDEDDDFNPIIEAHYREKWSDVRAAFVERIENYEIDEEAKATFTEALAAHEAGLYRAVTRVLFPEIERLAIQEIRGEIKGETGPRALKTAAKNLGLSDVEPGGMYAFRLFEKLFDHLYASTKTPEDLAKIAVDPVPNRHAAMHGFVPYATAKNSINMLVMADFLFQVICAVKAQQQAQDTEETASAA